MAGVVMSERPIRLGSMRVQNGSQTCVCEPKGDGVTCDKQATRHFLWLREGSTSPVCQEHADWLHTRDAYTNPYDEHQITAQCEMPGVRWLFSTPGNDD